MTTSAHTPYFTSRCRICREWHPASRECPELSHPVYDPEFAAAYRATIQRPGRIGLLTMEEVRQAERRRLSGRELVALALESNGIQRGPKWPDRLETIEQYSERIEAQIEAERMAELPHPAVSVPVEFGRTITTNQRDWNLFAAWSIVAVQATAFIGLMVYGVVELMKRIMS